MAGALADAAAVRRFADRSLPYAKALGEHAWRLTRFVESADASPLHRMNILVRSWNFGLLFVYELRGALADKLPSF